MKFYKCTVCKKVITILNETGTDTVCCSKDMIELIPGTSDASSEKHVPVIETNGNITRVYVGTVTHPMEENHYIQWICLETSNGYQIKYLTPGQKCEASFVLSEEDKVINAYAYCNLHSLWASC